MGRPMAGNLLGPAIRSWPTTAAARRVDQLTPRGAHAARSAAEVAERSEVVITMLPDSPQVSEVMEDVLAGACRANS